MVRVLLMLFVGLISFQIQAQKAKLIGKITDASDGSALYGVNIIIDGTSEGVSTDLDGNYTLDVPAGMVTLKYSYISYATQKKTLYFEENESYRVDITLAEEVAEIGLTVISGSKYEKNINEEVVSMEIIKPDKVQNTGNTMAETLMRTPGFSMIGETPSIRGGSGFSSTASSRVLVLLDGLPVQGPDNGGIRWNILPLENIQQMEIIKGASSALYGSSAMNGVLNIITGAPKDEPYTKIIVNAGGYQKPANESYSRPWADSNHIPVFTRIQFIDMRKFKKFDLSSGFSFSHDESHLIKDENTVMRGNFKLRHVSQRINGLSAGVSANLAREWGHDFFIWQGLNRNIYLPTEVTPFVQRSITVDPFLTVFDKRENRHGFKLRYYHTLFDNQTQELSITHQILGDYTFRKENVLRKVSVTAGASGYFTSVRGKTFGNHSTNNFGAFVQVDKKLLPGDRLNLSFGTRLEYFRADSLTSKVNLNPFAGPDDTGGITSPVVPVMRFGFNMRVHRATFIRGSFGQGYRFPNLAELFIDIARSGFPTKGNPNLQAEKAYSAELAIKQAFKIGDGSNAWIGYFDVAGFVTRYTDLIEPTFKPGFIQFTNVDNARISGLEVVLYSQGQLFNKVPLSIQAGYTYLQPINLDYVAGGDTALGPTSNFLKYRQAHSVKIDVETAWKMNDNDDGLYFGITVVGMSKTPEIDKTFSFSGQIEKYWTENNRFQGEMFIDARVRYKFNDHSEFSFICKNIFNQEVLLRIGKLEAPRNFALQYAYTF